MLNANKNIGVYRDSEQQRAGSIMEDEEPIYLMDDANHRLEADDEEEGDENPYVEDDGAGNEKPADEMDEEDVDDNKLYLSILVKSGQLACSYFDLNQ